MSKVWIDQVDKKYDVYVAREDSKYKGTLKIELNGQLLHSQEVDISYGARFGPDIQDVHDWQNICCAFVDKLEAEQKKT